MPKGYWIIRIDVHDLEGFKAYAAAAAGPLARHGARFIVRGGSFENPEGEHRARNIVLEFPSYQSALDCWHSPEYQELIGLRTPYSTIDLVIIDGYDGPQPS